MKKWAFVFFCSALLFLFGSCRSTRTVTVTEYVTVPVDIAPVVEPVFSLRPDNGELTVIEDVKDLNDVLLNSATYLHAWIMWQTYAEALEQTIRDVEEVYGSEKDPEALAMSL